MEENGSEGAVPNSDGSNTSTDVKPKLEVKSSPNERPESPDSNCAICLGKLQNKSFTDSCLHQFCFSCLVEWSKVKPECPLCKQGFESIIHNVRSIEDYDQYDILRPVEQPTVSIRNFAELLVGSNRPAFRFRTTMVPVIGLLQRVDSFIPPVYSSGHSHHGHSRHSSGHSHRSGSGGGPATIDRRYIYNQGLWVRRLPDITGRYRKCSPRFLAQNPAQVHRLVPWLHRELSALLGSGRSCEAAMTEIMSMLVQHPIRSVEFRNGVETFLGSRTDHFIHEFHSFAISPYDTIGYDRYASYGPGPVSSFHYEQEVDSSSSSDSDVQIVDEVIPNPVDVSSTSGSRSSASPEAGPSGVVNIRATSSVSLAPCIDLATEAESDIEDCVIIGTVKPRHLRTPEMITISDDDVGVENCNSGDEQNDVNVEDVSSEEDIKPTPEEIANISAESCKPSTSTYNRSKPQKMKMSKNSRFRRIYSKLTSSDSDSSSSSTSSSRLTSFSEDNWNESKRKRVKSRSSKKKSKEREKRAVKNSRQLSRTSTKRTKRDSSSSDSASSDDEVDYKRNRAKRKRVATNSSSISSHCSQRSRSLRVVESSPLRLKSVVQVRRNTQDSNYSMGDAASCSSHSHTGSDSRLMDNHSSAVATRSRSASSSFSSSSSSSSFSSTTSSSLDRSQQRRNNTSSKYKFKRKH